MKLSIEEMDEQNRGILAVAIAEWNEESWLKRLVNPCRFGETKGETDLNV
jgi:hypothetical protein